jgi:hypothetical protein
MIAVVDIIIFDIIEHGGLFENAVQKVFGYTPRYKSVGSGWGNGGIVDNLSIFADIKIDITGFIPRKSNRNLHKRVKR